MGTVPTLKSGLEFLLTRNSDVKKKGGFKKKGGKFPAKTRSKTPPILVRKPPQGRDSASRSGGLVGDHLCAEGEACERIRVRSASCHRERFARRTAITCSAATTPVR
jgi:hypothetical protein